MRVIFIVENWPRDDAGTHESQFGDIDTVEMDILPLIGDIVSFDTTDSEQSYHWEGEVISRDFHLASRNGRPLATCWIEVRLPDDPGQDEGADHS